MVQVLHLMGCQPDLQSERTSETLRRAAGPDLEITVRMIGRGGYYRNAGRAALALRFGRGTLFDIVHAWDVPSVIAACGSPSPIVFSPSQPPTLAPRWLRMAMVYRNGTVIANTHAMKRAFIGRGIPAFRCNLIPPAADVTWISSDQRKAIREVLGISDDDHVLLAPGESTRSAGHLLALHTSSILHVLDERYRLLLWGRGTCAGVVARLAGRLRQPRLLIAAEQKLRRHIPFEDLLAAADVALITSTALAPSLPIVKCLATGLPIVAAENEATSELMGASRTAVIVPRPAPRLLAKATLDLIEDPARAADMAKAALADVARRFDPRQATTGFFSLYRQLAGVAPKGAPVPQELAATR
jgi:glycosyltransferase involved in cell wall biosynthesis